MASTSTLSKPSSISLQGKKGLVEIIPIQTGTARLKTEFRDAIHKGLHGKLDILLDHNFTDPMPVLTWLVKHPEGIFIIDTGTNSRVNDPGYFDGENHLDQWINETQVRFEISKEQELGFQLRQMGIENKDIKKIILTHLHIDHADGLHDFEGVEIQVNKLEWEEPNLAVTSLFPKWFKPTLLPVGQISLENFPAFPLTFSDDLFLIHTPGHTVGHCSVLLKGADINIIFAGDVVYNQVQLKTDSLSMANQSPDLSEQSKNKLRTMMAKQRSVYLPSHDPYSVNRLMNLESY